MRAAIAALVLVAVAAQARRPNFVVVYLDDAGWSDLEEFAGEHGSKEHETKVMNELGRNGMQFMRAYSNGPNCAPSRAAIITGRYAPATGVYTVGSSNRSLKYQRLIGADSAQSLPAHLKTIGNSLQEAGYVTAHIGKWQFGNRLPYERGFDVDLGAEKGPKLKRGHHDGYLPPYTYGGRSWKRESTYPGTISEPAGGLYLSDRLSLETANFIRDNAEREFFVFLAHYGLHTPLEAPAELEKYYSRRNGAKKNTIAAALHALDNGIGVIVDQLKASGIEKDTLLIITSDNGGVGREPPLRGAKGRLYEGGIRVPMIVSWPQTVKPGSKTNYPVTGIDLFPTFLDAAGVPGDRWPKLDGDSFLSVIKNHKNKPKRRDVFFHFPVYLHGKGEEGMAPHRTTPRSVIMTGSFKLIVDYEDCHLELYNVDIDLSEKEDLAEKFPAMVNRMQSRLAAWREKTDAGMPIRNLLWSPTKQYQGIPLAAFLKRGRHWNDATKLCELGDDPEIPDDMTLPVVSCSSRGKACRRDGQCCEGLACTRGRCAKDRTSCLAAFSECRKNNECCTQNCKRGLCSEDFRD
eukprot:m.497529 g.497529  ORF g.497529 m.497529 type:complete len:575 (-) comp51410_c0_seq1:198-1922(-)